MNIQIFGKKKCFDTKKAERYFKERNIRVQMIDMAEKGMSKGEFTNVKQAVGGVEALIDENCKDKDLLALLVRNGKTATVGYRPEIWKEWDE